MTKISNLYALTNYLTVDIANGRIGVNTAIPGYTLDVGGTARITGAITGTSASFNTSYSNTSDLQIVSSGNIAGINIRSSQGGRLSIMEGYVAPDTTSFYTSTGTNNPSVEAIRIANGTGDVTFFSSIATIYASLLQVGSATGITNNARFTNPTTSTANGSGVGFDFALTNSAGSGKQTGQIASVWSDNGANSAADLVFYTRTSGAGISEKLRIAASGNVGIGTTTPISYQNYRYLQIDGSSTSQGGVVRLRTSDGSYVNEFAVDSGGGYISSSGAFQIYVSNTPRLYINTSGYVGIGTTTLSGTGSNLQVQQSGTPNIVAIRRGDSSNTGAARILWQAYNASSVLQNTAIIEAGLDGSSTEGYLALSAGTPGTPHMKLTYAGRVLIGIAASVDYLTKLRVHNATDSSYLDVTTPVGDATLRLSGTYGQIRNEAGDLYISCLGTTGDLIFRTNAATPRMRTGSTGFTASIKGASDAESKTFMDTIGNPCGLIPTPAGTTLYLYNRSGGTNYRVLLTSSTYFTGQHGNKPIDLDLKTNIQNYIGMIVSSNGTYHSVNPITQEVTTGKDAIQISEALPEVKLTDTDQDKSVWGVVTNVKNDNYNTDGTTETDNNAGWGDRLGAESIRINGLGEGAIWVTNINGNIENGDYICSSIIPGYGRKQNDDLLHNYTVAKSTMSCDFDLNNDQLYVCEEFQHNGTTYKKAFIGCTYHCS